LFDVDVDVDVDVDPSDGVERVALTDEDSAGVVPHRHDESVCCYEPAPGDPLRNVHDESNGARAETRATRAIHALDLAELCSEVGM
jgi:hypothetical protein